jgi:Pyruvate/2-oxoacid:ferredoxin oxidoreductase gamma subunit
MTGALVKALGGGVSKEIVREEIGKRMETKGNKEMARANIEAFDRAYNEVTEE